MRKQKKIMIYVCLLFCISLAGCGILKGFDAEAYTEAVLKQRLSGDTKALAELTEDVSEKELAAQYEEEIPEPLWRDISQKTWRWAEN